MTSQHLSAEERISVRAAVPASDLLYQPFIAASLLLAVLVGFLLAIHVPLGRLMETGRPERTADLIQAHGQAQLLGFAGLYVMGMTFRLLPRFASARLQLLPLAGVALTAMIAALLLRAVVMPLTSGELHDALLIASATGVLIAAASFFLIVAATLLGGARRQDASGIAFLLGGLMLVFAGEAGLVAAIRAVEAGSRTVSYLEDTAVVQIELLGFVLVLIAGVALRALPTISGRGRPERTAKTLPVALAAAAGLQGAALLSLEYAPFSNVLASLSGAAMLAFGLGLFVLLWQAAVLRPSANRLRPASRPHLSLVRAAFVWLAAAAAFMVYFGGRSLVSGDIVLQTDFDAIRHALGLGVITNLILGMSLLILPEAAAERQSPNRQRLLALALALLVNTAALLRVASALAGTRWSDDFRNLLMAVAGSFAEAAVLIFAAYLLRLMLQTRGGSATQG
ncbi:MAG TPA: NnrS family protein [Dehalococcoidia bacterium]|nr:NnrS family protein [Dehalococcoidia bacterium]